MLIIMVMVMMMLMTMMMTMTMTMTHVARCVAWRSFFVSVVIVTNQAG